MSDDRSHKWWNSDYICYPKENFNKHSYDKDLTIFGSISKYVSDVDPKSETSCTHSEIHLKYHPHVSVETCGRYVQYNPENISLFFITKLYR